MGGMLGLLALVVLVVPVLLVWVLVSLSGVKGRIQELEAEVARLRARTARAAGVQAPAPAPAAEAVDPVLRSARPSPAAPGPIPPVPEVPRAAPAPVSPPTEPARPIETAPAPGEPGPAPSPRPPMPLPPPLPSVEAVRARTSPAAVQQPPIPPRADAGESAISRLVRGWFSTGNVPVKIGVLVLLAGVAALLKYANDQGLLVVPLELRLAGVAAAALAALVFAWRRREHNRVFALSIQGGAVGVMLLVVFAAFKLYALIDPVSAFGLSVVLVAGAVVLAVLQNSSTLAAFALLAGYLAPIWLSTGSGNHVALFSYYALLNTAVVVVAWFKSWRVLNLLGFVFTFGIATLWGADAYVPAKYATTQPFLALFFLFYLLVPLLFARRRPEGRRDVVDGCLVFGTPLVAFSLQAALMEGQRMPLAYVALGVAAVYALLAWLLLRRSGYDLLARSYAVLAVGFATLSVPLALTARATASVLALEGSGVLWLGLHQRRFLPQLAGVLLQFLAAVALLVGLERAHEDVQVLFNPTALGMVLIAIAGFASAWVARLHGRAVLAGAFYLWGLGWWVANGIHEVERFLAPELRAPTWLVFAAASAWLAAEVHRHRAAMLLPWTLFGSLLAALALALWQLDLHQHPFGGAYGGLAWLVFALLGLRALACMREDAGGGAGVAQFSAWLLAPLVLSLEAHWLADRYALGQGWELALLAAPWLATLALGLWRWPWLAAPRDADVAEPLRMPLLLMLFIGLGCGWLVALKSSLDPAPLGWLPLLNPGELVQLAILALAVVWLSSDLSPAGLRALRNPVLAIGGFLLLSASTLRGVHFWGQVPWDGHLSSTSLAQTALTVVWSVLGVLGWIIGSRSARRGLWLASAVLMAVVLGKLVLVDRSHLGNLTGIVSFMAYGLLCVIVGYLAPAPPRAGEERA
jgi:uncharacterized membrane protein